MLVFYLCNRKLVRLQIAKVYRSNCALRTAFDSINSAALRTVAAIGRLRLDVIQVLLAGALLLKASRDDDLEDFRLNSALDSGDDTKFKLDWCQLAVCTCSALIPPTLLAPNCPPACCMEWSTRCETRWGTKFIVRLHNQLLNCEAVELHDC